MLSPHPESMISLMPVEGLAIRVAELEDVYGCVSLVGAVGGVVYCMLLVSTVYGPSMPEADRSS